MNIYTTTITVLTLLVSSNALASEDIVWRHSNGQLHYWPVENGQRTGGINVQVVDQNWRVVGIGDLDGDRHDDVVWRHKNGQLHYWPMKDGRQKTKSGINIHTPVDAAWKVVGVGDINGDRFDDVVWRHANGQVHYWSIRAGKRTGGFNIHTPVGKDWTVVGVGEVDGHFEDDIVWRHNDGQVHYWPIRKGKRTGGINIHTPVGKDWSVVGIGQIDGKLQDDIVWRRNNGQVHYWPIEYGKRTGGRNIHTPVGKGWTVVGIGKIGRDARESKRLKGYVLTHEHPVYGLAFGGNYAFAGRTANNYVNGMPEKGYDGPCSGCRLGGGKCDHGRFKGSLSPFFMGKDIGYHEPFAGPRHNSFSHLRYANDWIKEAYRPTKGHSKDVRMRIMMAMAVESEAMCDQVYKANREAGGPGGKGFACSHGDSKASLVRQIDAIKAWAKRERSWVEIAYNASDIRRIAAANKLAVVLGIESDYSFGNEGSAFDPVDRLDEYYRMGVRTFYLAHKVNSRLAGADIFQSRKTIAGKTIRVIQSLVGCFYVDDNIGDFPVRGTFGKKLCDNEKKCEEGAIRGKIGDKCAHNVSQVSEVNMLDYLRQGAQNLNGFIHYPLPENFKVSGAKYGPANRAGSYLDKTGVERNNLGLSYDGERVVRAAMKKGMIMNIDHVSSKARQHIYHLATRVFKGYPLNALHVKPNERLKDVKGSHRHEFDFDPNELSYIKNTGGFYGYRAGPSESKDYPESGITARCPKTATEAGKMFAWLIDQGFDVGYSLDYATVTEGVHSRTLAKCGLNLGPDVLHKYDKHVAEGLTHVGMMRHWHDELATVGLKKEYLDRLKYDSAEEFVRMWERSEQAKTTGSLLTKKIKFGKVVEKTCKKDSDCGNGHFCNKRIGKNRCLPDRSTPVGQTCKKNRECKTNLCLGDNHLRRLCSCRQDGDCSGGEFCAKRSGGGSRLCLAPGAIEIGGACSENKSCKTNKCEGPAGKKQCVCKSDSDCPGGKRCQRRAGKNICLELNKSLSLGQACLKDKECTTGKCEGKGAMRKCVCAKDSHCGSGQSCKKPSGRINYCSAVTNLALGQPCSANKQCSSNQCAGRGTNRMCVCKTNNDCGSGLVCVKRGINRCEPKGKPLGASCTKNRECQSKKCQGSRKRRSCVCSSDSDCGSGFKCKKRARMNICKKK